MFVIGTAGHVDHGKSTLVQALTGIDPDRLREEKERGLTIDLGFAWLTLPSGREVSIVDVPGHERFIKNMLAGAGGIDIALLVVAADEGPMPQTREHLAILDLLDIPRGVVAVTRCDLADEDLAGLVEAEMEDVLRGTRLGGSEIVRVSAVTGKGLPELLAALDRALDAAEPKRDLGRPRLPVDRAFTIQGFGTVLTGTLVDGSLAVGQDVELQPGGIRGRVRGLQRHRSKVDHLEPGTRAAVNVSGIRAEDVERGMVLAPPGALHATNAVDIRLRATNLLPHPVAHNAGITFLCATAESQGRLRLLDREELLPGDECWAQVVLESPIALLPRDHAVVRTANDTIGGGPVVAIDAPRHRRHHQPTLDALQQRLEGSPAERLAAELATAPRAPAALREALGLEQAAFATALADATAAGLAVELRGLVAGAEWLAGARSRLLAITRTFLDANELRAGIPREQLRSAARLPAAVFDAVLEAMLQSGELEERGPVSVAPAGHAVVLSTRMQQQADAWLAALSAGRFSPPTDLEIDAALAAYLQETGHVESTRGGVIFDRAVFDEMVAMLRAHIEAHGQVTLAETRDLFQASRKYAQAFLEHLDELRITRRVGDARVLR